MRKGAKLVGTLECILLTSAKLATAVHLIRCSSHVPLTLLHLVPRFVVELVWCTSLHGNLLRMLHVLLGELCTRFMALLCTFTHLYAELRAYLHKSCAKACLGHLVGAASELKYIKARARFSRELCMEFTDLCL